MDFYIIYPVLSAIPTWFLVYSISRICRHYKDGSDRIVRRSKYLYTKYACTFLIALVHSFQMVEVLWQYFCLGEDLLFTIIIGGYFFLLVLSWLCSCYMVRFELRKSLPMMWSGHRSFWVISFGNYVIVIALFILFQNSWFSHTIRYCTYGLGSFLCLILMLLALFRPNEFPLTRDTDILSKATPLCRSVVNHLLEIPGSLRIRISDYKTKVQNNKQILYFNIAITIDTTAYVIHRTYLEFDALHRSLRKLFPGEEFPYLIFPDFPVFQRNESIDKRMKDLETYLNCLKRQYEFMSEEFVDFLKIPPPYCQEVLQNHHEIIEKNRCANISNVSVYDTSSILIQETANTSSTDEYFSAGLQSFIQISIPHWHPSPAEYGAVVYHLRWRVLNTECSGSVEKYYKEFNALHGSMKKAVAPARLPPFPAKNYLHNLRNIDLEAVERRKAELEKYMSNVLNDPAFQCYELLQFIGCPLRLEEIWEKYLDSFQYYLQSSASWETEEEGGSFVQRYTFPIVIMFKGVKQTEWAFSRRFSEFDKLHRFLVKRNDSPFLAKFLMGKSKGSLPTLPELPRKGIIPLTSHNQLEERKMKLETYLEECLKNYSVRISYAFRCFIKDPS